MMDKFISLRQEINHGFLGSSGIVQDEAKTICGPVAVFGSGCILILFAYVRLGHSLSRPGVVANEDGKTTSLDYEE